jgi:hypothetical protein
MKSFKSAGKKNCIFDIDDLNLILERFEYGRIDRRNNILPFSTTESKYMKLKGAQMYLFLRIFPIIGSDLLQKNENYLNLLHLIRICKFFFCHKFKLHELGLIEREIFLFFQKFKLLYPDASIIPKLHYLVHYPRLIKEFGPLKECWTMRFEAKHQYFKNLMPKIHCFKNVTNTLVKRHQDSQMLILNSKNFFKQEIQDDSKCASNATHQNVTCNGIKYQTDNCILLNETPEVLQIKSINLMGAPENQRVQFACFKLKVLSYLTSMSSFEVVKTDDIVFVFQDTLEYYNPFDLYSLNGKFLVSFYHSFFLKNSLH